MNLHGYAVNAYQEEDGTWAAEVPDLPGCVAAGADPVELFQMLDDAIDGWIESAQADGAPVPAPSREPDFSGKFLVRAGRSLHRQLVWRAKADGLSLNQYVVTALVVAVSKPEEPYLWPTQIGSNWLAGQGSVHFTTLGALNAIRTVSLGEVYHFRPKSEAASPRLQT